jgi:hypothetical protein
MDVGLEDRDTDPASERERTRTSDPERREAPEWPPLAAAMRWLERYLAEAEPKAPALAEVTASLAQRNPDRRSAD